MSENEASAKDTHCGFVAVIGAPNAGKSTLVNALVGAKVSIVTYKAQTTRARMRGIAIAGKSQIVLVDTPGIFRPKRRLDRAMVETAWTEAREADVAVLVLDAIRGMDDVAEPIFQQAGELKIPLVLALNKVDKIDKAKLLALASEASKSLPLEQLFMVSALSGDGVEDLKTYLASRMPPGPWLFPEDQIADAPLRQWAAEVTSRKDVLTAPRRDPLFVDGRNNRLETAQRRLHPHRANNLCGAPEPAQNCSWRKRAGDQTDFNGSAPRNRRGHRNACSFVPLCKGEGELGRRSRAIPGNGARLSEIMNTLLRTMPHEMD